MSSVAIRLRHDPAVRSRLFCLPHAGAGASQYHSWSFRLPHDLQLCPIQLPGREHRLREQPPKDLSTLVRDLADAMAPHLELPFAIFGHSMGAAIGFELARELRRRDLETPTHLLMSGFRAPHRPPTGPPLSGLPSAAFLEAVQHRYGPFADEILREPILLALILPTLRADLALIETYCCAAEAPFSCPITVFTGASDPTVTEDELTDWRLHTRADFELCTIPGGHFFPQESRDLLLSAVMAHLRAGAGRPNATSADGW